jgi:hypothetical protein
MKRCPECYRIEADDVLAFCRADGTALVSGSSSERSGSTLNLRDLWIKATSKY